MLLSYRRRIPYYFIMIVGASTIYSMFQGPGSKERLKVKEIIPQEQEVVSQQGKPERRKGVDLHGRAGGEALGGETVIKTYYVRKISFQ